MNTECCGKGPLENCQHLWDKKFWSPDNSWQRLGGLIESCEEDFGNVCFKNDREMLEYISIKLLGDEAPVLLPPI